MLYVMALIRDKLSVQGYRVIDTDVRAYQDIPIGSVSEMATNIQGVSFDSKFKCLVSTTGINLTDLPSVDMSGVLFGKAGSFITNEIYDSDKLVGYIVVSTYGEVLRVNIESMADIARKTVQVNYSLDGNGLAVPIRGYQFQRVDVGDFKRSSYNSALDKGYVPQETNFSMPVVPRYSVKKVYGSDLCKPADIKLSDAFGVLKACFPYYWVILKSMDTKPCDDDVCKTMAVSESRFIYNIKFVSMHTIEELVFVLLHETYHIIRMDVLRCGNRDPELWNVAADLYINETLLTDHGLEPGKLSRLNDTRGNSYKYGIQPLQGGLYFGKLFKDGTGLPVDLKSLTVEKIYKHLQKNSKSKGGGSGSSKKGDNGNESSSSGDKSSGDKSNGGSFTYDGKEIQGSTFDTIMSETGRHDEDSKEQSDKLAKQTLENIKVNKQKTEERIKAKLAGTGTGAFDRNLDFNTRSKLDWRKVLHKIIKSKPAKKYTLSMPEQTYSALGATVASRQRIGKPTELKGIVICIDSSGSVDTKVLSKFLSEVGGIFNHYKVDGELLYCTTEVCDSGRFSNRQSLQRVDSNWSGGTDVSCVFKYLSGGSKTSTGKACNFRGKDIKAVLILTDGYFSSNYEKYANMFGNRTIWIIDGKPEDFVPCFGTVVSAED